MIEDFNVWKIAEKSGLRNVSKKREYDKKKKIELRKKND